MTKAIKFEDLRAKIDGVKYRRGKKPWEIFLPYNTDTSVVHSIIAACRSLLLVSWHIAFTEPTDENQEPEIRMYWDQNASTE
jgi:hypothetical protein